MNKYPYTVFDSIIGQGFTIKETSAPVYFLGGDFECDEKPRTNNEILTQDSKTYVRHMMDNFNNNFGYETYKSWNTLEIGRVFHDHPHGTL